MVLYTGRPHYEPRERQHTMFSSRTELFDPPQMPAGDADKWGTALIVSYDVFSVSLNRLAASASCATVRQ